MTAPSSPPPAPAQQDAPGPFPAPYEEPWGRLAVDLRAAVASTGLKLRELWRRNGAGDLSVPGFWPQELAPLFWPLLLGLVLSVLLGLGWGLLRGLANLSPPPPSAVPAAPGPLPQPPPPLVPPVPVSVDSAPGLQQPAPLEQLEPRLELDPLLALLAEDDPEGCIAFARPVPQEGRLDLEMASAYRDLTPSRRQQQADHWLERSRALGYEHLRLIDAHGGLLAQAARVGTGMVMLDPQA